MKKRMRYLTLLVVCIVFICGIDAITANATTLGMATYSLTDEEKASLLERLNFGTIEDDRNKTGIQCFDVSENGTIALAVEGDFIYVYDQLGIFQYGCSFRSDGEFGIEFQDEMLAIYFLRGNFIIILDADGKCTDIQKVIEPDQHLVRVLKILNRTSKEIYGKKYLLERDIDVGEAYSRFVIEEGDKRIVLYDVTVDHNIETIMLIVGLTCISTFMIFGVIKKKMQSEEPD